MRVWIAVWTGSSALTRAICDWIRGGAAPRLLGLFLAAGFIKGLPWTTSIAVLLALGWLLTAIALGLRLPAPAAAAAEPEASEPGTDNADEDASYTPADDVPEESSEPSRDLVVKALHGLLRDTGGVHLKALARALPDGPWTTGASASAMAYGCPVWVAERACTGTTSHPRPPPPRTPPLLPLLAQARATTTTPTTPRRTRSRARASSRTRPTRTAGTSSRAAREPPPGPAARTRPDPQTPGAAAPAAKQRQPPRAHPDHTRQELHHGPLQGQGQRRDRQAAG
jgi:hypothetical protein